MEPTVALLRLATAVKRAFPARAEAVLAEVDLWFHPSTDDPACSLCGRFLATDFAATHLGVATWRRVTTRAASFALSLCPHCVRLSPQDSSGEALLADILRAVRAVPFDRAEELCTELERRFHSRHFRGVEEAACAACGTVAPCAVGKRAVCFACVDRASVALDAGRE